MRTYSFIGSELMEPYMEYCKTVGSWTEHRAGCLSSLDSYCSQNWPDAKELKQEMIYGWCSKRPTEQINTFISRCRPIKHFLKYQRERGRINIKDPEIPVARLSTYIPHPFTADELKRFFDVCDHVAFNGNKRNCRNLQLTLPVFFRLLYSTGMRTTEARQLKRNDIDLKAGVISIKKTKGFNQHYVALHDSMLELMKYYDEAMLVLCPDREYFFPDHKGLFHPNYWVDVHFRKLWRKVSSTNAIPYAFRHHYAVANINQWIDEGFNFFDKLVYLSKSMGHCDLESTKGYYSLVPAISSILKDKTENSFNDIIPEVAYEESDE
ncbi:MAG: tyrosine-type recombinase/integrase [Peptostreptococcaceae bacterium]|nr:tyrosine-type recombinase/integrase [Peptostreptococcaceae bacterium]